MPDIFEDKSLYPHYEKIIKEHFKEYYDTVFVALLPFFKVENSEKYAANLKRSEEITLEQAKEEIEGLKNFTGLNATIYSYSNEDYPTDDEILKSSEIIPWATIIRESGLKDASEMNKALRTSIGALRKVFRREELVEKLESYTTKHQIWHPTEGRFDAIAKAKIYRSFKRLNKRNVIVTTDYYDSSEILDLEILTEAEFIEKVLNYHYYIYSEDREILFSIDWDSFFFLIASSKENVDSIISENNIEGFFCDENTVHDWDYEEGEMDYLLSLENSEAEKKKWWEFWK